MPKHSTRRGFLRANGGLRRRDFEELLAWRPSRLTEAADSAARGRRFLASLFDPAVGLLPEFRGSKVYWLYHDNYLAAKVLDRTEPDLAGRSGTPSRGSASRARARSRSSSARRPSRSRSGTTVSIEVKRVGEKVIKTELVGGIAQRRLGRIHRLALPGCRRQGRRGQGRGREALRGGDWRRGTARVQGPGEPQKRLYATYKLALALIAAARLNRHPERRRRSSTGCWPCKREDGGFVTDYDAQGRPVGQANVETTSLAILALDGEPQPVP